jgi:predicted Zn-dependent peptidase
MFSFEKFELANGLKVLVHEDPSTVMVCVNILYDVGARDEDEKQTGFAHLFEHLMFGGSVNIPAFDEPMENAGGKNNAFTSNDVTNYYETLPVENLETALWLESDRLLSLAFSSESLEVQRKVVCEEFKEHYINQPYGDVSHLIRQLAYTTHPYKWPTIGKELKHVEDAVMEDVKAFFKKHYAPNNAILVIAGNVKKAAMELLVNKWFADIPAAELTVRNLPVEPKQTEKRTLSVTRKVPANAIYLSFHASARNDDSYYVMDLITDLLSSGRSSRLYQHLVKEQQLFSTLECYHYGSLDKGLIQIEGKLNPNITMEQAESAIMSELAYLQTNLIDETELQKVKNKIETQFILNHIDLSERAFSLAYYELIFNDANRINNDLNNYQIISAEQIKEYASNVFQPSNCSIVYYHKSEEVVL